MEVYTHGRPGPLDHGRSFAASQIGESYVPLVRVEECQASLLWLGQASGGVLPRGNVSWKAGAHVTTLTVLTEMRTRTFRLTLVYICNKKDLVKENYC